MLCSLLYRFPAGLVGGSWLCLSGLSRGPLPEVSGPSSASAGSGPSAPRSCRCVCVYVPVCERVCACVCV